MKRLNLIRSVCNQKLSVARDPVGVMELWLTDVCSTSSSVLETRRRKTDDDVNDESIRGISQYIRKQWPEYTTCKKCETWAVTATADITDALKSWNC